MKDNTAQNLFRHLKTGKSLKKSNIFISVLLYPEKKDRFGLLHVNNNNFNFINGEYIMKKLLVAASILALSACTAPQSHIGSALISTLKDSQIANESNGTKVGKTCAANYLGIFATGDMSVETAKKNGKITKVATVDRDIKNMIIFAEVCTIVTGN